jgi:cell division septation protein DedD
MKPSSILTLLLALACGVFAAGCTASSELAEENDTRTSSAQDSAAIVPPVVKPSVPVQTNKQGFTTKEDTIEVESAQRNHRPEHTPVIVQKRTPAAQGVFCVQIGAFKEEANAQHAKEVFEKRYRKPAVKVFDETLKLYRVAGGTFQTHKEAARFAAAMKKKYPREYRKAWVIRKPE